MFPKKGRPPREIGSRSGKRQRGKRSVFEEHGGVGGRAPQPQELVVPLGDVELEAGLLLHGEDLAHHVGHDRNAQASRYFTQSLYRMSISIMVVAPSR